MPKRIPNSPDENPFSEHHRTDGYTARYYLPHSPFQKLIHAAMERKQLSLRGLAAELGIAPSSLWIWLHNENGFPGKRSFYPETHVPMLASILNLPEKEIEDAIDLSRTYYAQKSIPAPGPITGAFDDLIEILENRSGRTVNRDWIINLAKRLRAGAVAETVASEESPIYHPEPPAPAKTPPSPARKTVATRKKSAPAKKRR